MTLDEAIALINASGWYVNNLYQTMQGRWRCNLRYKENNICNGYAEADDPKAAILAALDNTDTHAGIITMTPAVKMLTVDLGDL